MIPDETHVGISDEELSGDIGPPDPSIMQTIRNLFCQEEPLVKDATFDSVLQPSELRLQFSDGIDTAEWCRLDVTWFRSGAYRFHYVDSEAVHWRFDRHPNPHSPEKHFHEPPDAHDHTAVESCVTVEEATLVARAVLKLWRRAYETGNVDQLNTAENPS